MGKAKKMLGWPLLALPLASVLLLGLAVSFSNVTAINPVTHVLAGLSALCAVLPVLLSVRHRRSVTAAIIVSLLLLALIAVAASLRIWHGHGGMLPGSYHYHTLFDGRHMH